MPTSDGRDDLVGVLGPSEWLRVLIGFFDEAVNSGLKGDDGVEHAAFEPSAASTATELMTSLPNENDSQNVGVCPWVGKARFLATPSGCRSAGVVSHAPPRPRSGIRAGARR